MRRRKGELVYAHRLAWEEVHGPILAGMVIHHECGNRACVNVAHLRLMTQRSHGLHHHKPITVCPRCGSTERRPVRTRPGKTYCVQCVRSRERGRSRPKKDYRIGAPMVECGCGCGEMMPSVTKTGKPRRFKHGHNMRANPWHGKRPDPWRLG